MRLPTYFVALAMLAMTLPVGSVASAYPARLALNGASGQVTTAQDRDLLDEPCGPASQVPTEFVDVSATQTHARSIACIARWEVAQGVGGNRFDGDRDVTRGQIATILENLLGHAHGLDSDPSDTAFSDVAGSTHETAIAALATRGYIRGYPDGTFRPNQPVSRAQVSSILVPLLEDLLGRDLDAATRPTDVTASSTHETSIRKLVGSGVSTLRGDASFDPNAPINRAQMATLTMSAAGLLLDAGAVDRPASADGACVSSSEATRVSRHGITVELGDGHECGTYANGDVWVVGPVEVVEIDPAPQEGSRAINGAMINPSPRDGDSIGYGDIRANSYDPDLNVARDVSASDPLEVAPDSSLVTTISADEPDARPGIESAMVITVVDQPPPPGAFRPPYSGDDKTAQFTVDDLRTELLPRLEPVPGAPRPSSLASEFEQVWLDHVPRWQGRKIHPANSMPDYGRDMASLLGRGSLALLLDHPPAEKQQLLINYVQIGIDFYGIVEDGGQNNWWPDGGHAQGRKWPILFAGTMLDDPDMARIGDRDDVMFGEDAQTFYVTQDDVDRGVGYTTDDLGMAEWGLRHATDPSRDDPSWQADYRTCCTANSWGGHVLSARIMGLQDAWNHDPLFNYTDRYLNEQPHDDWERFADRPFTENMWDHYRPQH